MFGIDKNHPTEAWINHLRRTFPCDREIDRILTRKLLRRAGPAYAPVNLETLVRGVEALLRKHLQDDFRVFDPGWMTGGASKLQMAFSLDWNSPGVGRTVTRLVLRMEPAASIVETSRLREFQLIRALRGCIPVPQAYWVDAEGEFLPHPAIICGFVEGVTQPSDGAAGVSGVGTTFPPSARAALARQFVECMGAMHRFNWQEVALDAFDAPALGAEAAERQINWWQRVWEEDVHEDIPLVRLAIAWMRQNLPVLDHVSLVHGDYRTGNFLYDEASNRITAVLDWETAHLGDRHEDLVYMTNAPYKQLMDDGKTYMLGGLMTEASLYEAYEKVTGLPVIPASLKFYKILNALKVLSVVHASGYRSSRCAKTHQDVVLAWVMGFAPVVLDDLRCTLEGVL
jgi:aminoglycoside phosphotransferase (APT) family kinase protein